MVLHHGNDVDCPSLSAPVLTSRMKPSCFFVAEIRPEHECSASFPALSLPSLAVILRIAAVLWYSGFDSLTSTALELHHFKPDS